MASPLSLEKYPTPSAQPPLPLSDDIEMQLPPAPHDTPINLDPNQSTVVSPHQSHTTTIIIINRSNCSSNDNNKTILATCFAGIGALLNLYYEKKPYVPTSLYIISILVCITFSFSFLATMLFHAKFKSAAKVLEIAADIFLAVSFFVCVGFIL
uniref:Uncharacterized protein n=1 Tax=Nelumbo nucifera TaxID=4432 RepID=A0A822YV33_NELNU|nr:TPA_asm: hypothetical protein HUJ06_007173 [Nelumbo nucifera]